MPPRIAAVTMVYNEPDFLPRWLTHYTRLVGAEHCHVIDHGSDDGSTDALGPVNRLRLPRSPQDDARRARFISRFCAGLLEWYDWVLYSDVDELLVPDPRLYPDLAALCAAMRADVISAIGFNLHHMTEEPPLDPTRPLGAQRRWVRFSAAMCKPLLIRRAVNWAPGFHGADAEITFAPLYLIHLRWIDRDLGLRRLAKTRAMPWADPAAAPWQRAPDAELMALHQGFADLPRENVLDFSLAAPPIADALAALLATESRPPYPFDLDLTIDALWPLPKRLLAALA